MAVSHVAAAPVAKRAELAGVIAQTERQLGQFRAEFVHLDAALRLFAPEMDPKTIPAKRIRQAELCFEQAELPRRVLDALRRASVPIRAPDVARAEMIDKGLDPEVRDTLDRLKKRRLLALDGVGHGIRPINASRRRSPEPRR